MTTLVLNFDAASPPGALGPLLSGIPHRHLWPVRGGGVDEVAWADRVVLLGGDLPANDPLPALAELRWTLAARHAAGRPTLGICLGAQILATALGGTVSRMPAEELGVLSVELTPEGRADPLFRGLQDPLPVVQAHGERIAPPLGAALLARSPACPVQAYRLGASTGLQFHPEAEPDTLRGWAATAPVPHPGIEAEISARFQPAAEAGRLILSRWLAATA